MKRIFIIGLVLIVGMAMIAGMAMAWGPGFGRGFGAAANGVPPLPDLTADQSAQIQALRAGFLAEIKPLRENLFTKRMALRSLWSSADLDPAAVTALQKEIRDLQADFQEKVTGLRLEIRKLLTPEQLTQLPALNQDGTYGPGAGFGRRGFGAPMGMRGPLDRW